MERTTGASVPKAMMRPRAACAAQGEDLVRGGPRAAPRGNGPVSAGRTVRAGQPTAAGWAGAPKRWTFTGKGDQKILSALPAPSAGEAVGENAAFQVAAKLPLHVSRHAAAFAVLCAGERQIGLEMPLHRRRTPPTGRRCTSKHSNRRAPGRGDRSGSCACELSSTERLGRAAVAVVVIRETYFFGV